MAKSEIAAKLQAGSHRRHEGQGQGRLGVLRMLQAAVKQVEVDERQ